MVGVEIVGTITTVITTVVLVGGMILGAVRWQTGQAEKKANKVKEEIESAAKIVKDETTKHVTDLKAYSDNSAKNLEQRIAEVDRKVIEMLDDLRKRADLEARQIGIQVVDVRLKRVDYAEEISKSVFDRMIAERKRLANQLRSEGSAASEKIRADADKQREVIIAEAYRDAQKTKGEGDASAAAIYNQAYGKNPEFYAFYRSQEAYKNSFKSKSDVMVLDPGSDFFKYMRSPTKK